MKKLIASKPRLYQDNLFINKILHSTHFAPLREEISQSRKFE